MLYLKVILFHKHLTTEAAMKQNYFPSDDAREKLVLAVQEYPCLWDSSLESYHTNVTRANAWNAVAEQCGYPGKGKSFA